MTAERFHHSFSPSTLQFLAACPTYQSSQSDNPAAEVGTRQHRVAETGQDDNQLSDQQAEAAAGAMAFVAEQKRIMEEGGEVINLSEEYLPIDAEETTGGYADSLLISHDKTRAILTDFKFGQWAAPDASENLQGMAYSLGAFFRFPTLEQVQVFFFQPAVEKLNTVVWYKKDVPELLLRVRTIVARAKLAREKGDFSTAAPHTPVCLFCKHLAVCPAVAAKVISVARKFAPLDVPSDLTPTRVYAPEEAAAGMQLAGLVETWAKAFKSLVTDRVLRGGTPPVGYELTSRATREVVDERKFREISLAFLSEADYISLMSPPAITVIEKIISDKSPRGQKSQNIEAFKAATEDAGAVQKRQPYAFLKQKTSE